MWRHHTTPAGRQARAGADIVAPGRHGAYTINGNGVEHCRHRSASSRRGRRRLSVAAPSQLRARQVAGLETNVFGGSKSQPAYLVGRPWSQLAGRSSGRGHQDYRRFRTSMRRAPVTSSSGQWRPSAQSAGPDCRDLSSSAHRPLPSGKGTAPPRTDVLHSSGTA